MQILSFFMLIVTKTHKKTPNPPNVLQDLKLEFYICFAKEIWISNSFPLFASSFNSEFSAAIF